MNQVVLSARKAQGWVQRLSLSVAVCAGLLLGAALIRYSRAAETAQGGQGGDGATAQALIQEIRALRRALQDSTTGTLRTQVAMERCRMQQLTVERLTDEHNSIQTQIESNQEAIQQMEASAKTLEHALAGETEPARRGDIEREYKAFTTGVEQRRQQNNQLQARAAQVSGALQSEKGKLNELREALDAFDRALAGQPPERK